MRTRVAVAVPILVSIGIAIFTFAPSSRQPPTDLRLGTIEFRLQIPPGWELLDYGDRRELRKGFDGIAIAWRPSSHVDLELQANRVLEKTLGDGRREVASREPIEVDGHEALDIKTWDHWSHEHPRRFVFVKHAAGALELSTMEGALERTGPVFDELVRSVAFADSQRGRSESP